MKIVVLDSLPLVSEGMSFSVLEKYGTVEVYESSTPEETLERIADADAVFTNKVELRAREFEKARNLKYVGVLATGFNIIDLDEARKHSVVVTNVPTYGTDSVAQFAVALLLELCHHIQRHSDDVLSGAWTASGKWCYWLYPQVELAGKTIGIIGYGRIGQRSGALAKAFGMNVLMYDNYVRKELEDERSRYASLDEIFSSSDVIFLHCPLTKETEGIINKENISKMKDGVLIVNNSRGPLVDEAALAEALDSGKVGGAALDVVSSEPISAENPLLKAKNVIITPHISWASYESRKRLFDIAIGNFESFLSGKSVNVVS